MFEMKWFLFCTNNRGDRQRFPIGLQQPRPQLNSTKEGEIESSPVASGPSRGEGGGGGAPGSGHCLVLGGSWRPAPRGPPGRPLVQRFINELLPKPFPAPSLPPGCTCRSLWRPQRLRTAVCSLLILAYSMK